MIFPSEPRAPALPGRTPAPQAHPSPPTCGSMRLLRPHRPVTYPRRARARRSTWAPVDLRIRGERREHAALDLVGSRTRRGARPTPCPPPLAPRHGERFPSPLVIYRILRGPPPSHSCPLLSSPLPAIWLRTLTTVHRLSCPRHLVRNSRGLISSSSS